MLQLAHLPVPTSFTRCVLHNTSTRVEYSLYCITADNVLSTRLLWVIDNHAPEPLRIPNMLTMSLSRQLVGRAFSPRKISKQAAPVV